MQPVMTAEINETFRYAAYYDEHHFDYLRDWDHDYWGLFTISVAWSMNALELDTYGLNDRLREVMQWTEHSWNHKHAETELGKAISRAGYDYKFVQLNGGSQSCWNYAVVYWDTKAITSGDGVIAELQAWYSGEVYTVALERLITYQELGGDRAIERWEAVESISNILFYDGYEFSAKNCDELLDAYQVVAA